MTSHIPPSRSTRGIEACPVHHSEGLLRSVHHEDILSTFHNIVFHFHVERASEVVPIMRALLYVPCSVFLRVICNSVLLVGQRIRPLT